MEEGHGEGPSLRGTARRRLVYQHLQTDDTVCVTRVMLSTQQKLLKVGGGSDDLPVDVGRGWGASV